MKATTTIKVPVALRDVINIEARRQGLTAASFLEGVIAMHLRQQRMQKFGEAFQRADDSYWDEFGDWGGLADEISESRE